jgi:peptidoglycan/xylan/chitin deacetylase (PgdA/CDA1 family)
VLSLIPNKREFLAGRLRDVGAVRLLERAARRPGLLVATHHRVGDPAASPYYEPVYSASPEAFRAQVRYLRDHFRVVTLQEVEAGAGREGPSVLITFDDGYRDNFDAAFPILVELGVPATFFLPTGFLEAPRLPWWDHAAYVIKTSSRDRVVLDRPSPLTIDLTLRPRHDAVRAVIRLYLDGKVDDEPAFRAHLEERAGVEVDEPALGRELFMSWDQVRRLAGAGMAIGSHSHSHRNLAALPEPDQHRELAESKRVLERETGREVRALAYPFGWPGTFTDITRRLAESAGYGMAFSALAGVNRPRAWDRFALRRLSVGFHDSPALLRARVVFSMTFGGSIL